MVALNSKNCSGLTRWRSFKCKNKYILVNISPAMEQSLLIIFSSNDSNNKFGLDTNTNPKRCFFRTDNDDKFWLFNNDNEEDDIEENDMFSSKLYNRWNYKKDYSEDAWKKLYWDWKACQHFILFRLFTMRLFNISDQAKNGLFIAFSRSNLFGILEYNTLLNALAYSVKGLNLFEYDELRFDLINNAKIQ